MIPGFVNFEDATKRCIENLLQYGTQVDTGRWQGVPTEGKPDLSTRELMDVAFRVSMDQYHLPYGNLDALREQIKPNLPWADDHFEERVSRVPSNPGEQYKNWPWWSGQQRQAMENPDPDQREETWRFTHTYQERFWPKHAGDGSTPGGFKDGKLLNYGIRYEYGDLDDVVNMLLKDPYTRQAYLPIFFPEDTGAVHGGRIPCTLGYHFLLRNNQLHLWYDIRSCDAVRHFRDDIYLAARLALWVIEELQYHQQSIGEQYVKTGGFDWQQCRPGVMTFHCHSFHVHKGDLHLLS